MLVKISESRFHCSSVYVLTQGLFVKQDGYVEGSWIDYQQTCWWHKPSRQLASQLEHLRSQGSIEPTFINIISTYTPRIRCVLVSDTYRVRHRYI
ncbi:hypothetical protein MTR_5g063480 [Medicago truncatula]|uniref:Uncharacterized protein n=1 Tax=Medicago truncatula TaxID=3880 RepID=G7KAE1_MEDTR|nr:hypothetical protein MTR_5g063480 [Medicago truncatula]